MKEILWLDLNSSYSHSSVALPSIHAQLDGDGGWNWSVVSATINEDPGEVAAKVYDRRPDVIAATCWVFTHERLIAILARVSRLLPEAVIILGGPEFLGDNSRFLRENEFVTCVFRGEGEISFPLWADRRTDKSRWHEVPGLCWIENGVYHDTGLAKSDDFSALAFPERSRFFNWSKAFVQLETTRGCFNTCAFCVSGGEKPVRILSMQQVRERLADIHAHGIKDVRMLDRTFNYDNSRAIEMLDLFTSYYPEMRFHLEIHPALLTEALKEKIATLPAGLLHIEAGIQSLDQNVLDACGRKGRLDAALDGLKYLASLNNIVVHADLIAGLPHYRLGQIFDDVRTLASYNIGEIQLESLKVLPGTRMRADAERLRLKYSPLPPYEVLMTGEMSPEELKRAMHLSRMIDFYYNSEAWQAVFREIILAEDGFMEKFLDHLLAISVISTPLSLERKGIILYEYCRGRYPQYLPLITAAWIEAGISLKKIPGDPVFRIKYLQRFIEEENLAGRLDIVYGQDYWHKEDLDKDSAKLLSEKFRIYCMRENERRLTLFGFDSEHHQPSPVFRAVIR